MTRLLHSTAVAAVLLIGLVGLVPRTSALLSDAAEVRASGFSVGTLGKPGNPTVGGSFVRRSYSWTAAALDVGGTGAPPVTYRLLYFDGPNDTQPTTICTVTQTSCRGEFLAQLGGGQVQVEASWEMFMTISGRTTF